MTSPPAELSLGGVGSSRRDFFISVANALAGLDVDGGNPQIRRKLTQPRSRATSPPLSPVELPRVNYGPGASPPRARKRKVPINDKMFADAKWTAEKQQFGVNGGLINAVHSAEKGGALLDYKWIGTLGMVNYLSNLTNGSLRTL